MKWLRLYSHALYDPKVQKLSPALFKHWVNLLCLASEQEERGILPSTEDIAFALRIKPSLAGQVVEELRRAGLIDTTPDGRLSPHNWTQRQRDSDDVATRVRNHRAQSKGRETSKQQDSESSSNADVTLHETLLKRTVDTDTERDTDKRQIHTVVSSLPDGVDGSTPLAASAPAEPPVVASPKGKVTPIRAKATPTPLPAVAPESEHGRAAPARINPEWDALVALMGYPPESKAEKSKWGLCVKQLKELHATPADIARRGAAWAHLYSAGTTLTPTALVSHWGELGKAADVGPTARASPARSGPRPQLEPQIGRSFEAVLAETYEGLE